MPESITQTHSIFEQPWWLNATAPGQWDVVEVEEGGKIVARLPFVVRKRYGLRSLTQPQLTQSLGPWIEHTDEPTHKRLAREKDLFGKLIRKLPKFDSFRQNFHPNVTNWLPFYWDGFTQTTRYSYVIDELEDMDQVFNSFSKTSRNTIRQASKWITVTHSDDVNEIIRLADLTFGRQGLSLPYAPDLLHRIDEAATQYAERRILLGVDEDHRVHSAAYVVGDSRRAYLLITGADTALRRSGSGNLVHWHAIQSASNFTSVFDFEGSMLEPIEDFYRKFGAEQSPYFTVSKDSRLTSAYSALRNITRR